MEFIIGAIVGSGIVGIIAIIFIAKRDALLRLFFNKEKSLVKLIQDCAELERENVMLKRDLKKVIKFLKSHGVEIKNSNKPSIK